MSYSSALLLMPRLIRLYRVPPKLRLIQRKEIALLSVMGTSRKNFLESVDILSRGLVNLDGMISARFPLKDIKKAYEYIDEKGDTLKVLLEM